VSRRGSADVSVGRDRAGQPLILILAQREPELIASPLHGNAHPDKGWIRLHKVAVSEAEKTFAGRNSKKSRNQPRCLIDVPPARCGARPL